MSGWLKMAVLLIVTVFLTRFIPFSPFFRNVDTLVHELSHALVTLLLSGSVKAIYLYANQSGLTLSYISVGWKGIVIGLAGYTGSSLFALLLFRLHAAGRERAGLTAVAVLAAVALALFVRNDYGMLWCAGFAALTGAVAIFAPYWLRYGYYLLIAFICLVESVVSSLYLVMIPFTNPGAASDAANLSAATHIPALLWGLAFAAFALWCAKLSTASLLKSGFRAKPLRR